MIHVFALIRRRADFIRDAFRAHYEDVHAPLALPLLPGLTTYVRNHIREELRGTPDFDVLSEFSYPDGKTVARSMALIEGPEGEAIRQDEASFMDRAAQRIVPVSRERIQGDDAPDQPGPATTWLYPFPEDADLAALGKRIREEDLPAAASDGTVVLSVALAGGKEAPDFGAIVQLYGERALEAPAGVALALGVTRHPTAMPPPA
jgi:uncharacterized protein (TIGR02118 family)